MCCCCCGPKPCTCWICFSMFLSVVSLILIVGVHLSLGGPLPTAIWDLTTTLLYAGNISGILFSIGAILIVRPGGKWVKENVANFVPRIFLLIFMTAGLLFPVAANIFFVVNLHRRVRTAELGAYAKAYYQNYHEPPPVLQLLEELKFGDLGCCGGESYADYLPPLQPCNSSNPRNFTLQFDGATTCCKANRFTDHFCASNLQVIDYELRLEFINRLLKAAANQGSKKVIDFGNVTREFVRDLLTWTQRVYHPTGIGNLAVPEGQSGFSPKYDCPLPVAEKIAELLPLWNSSVQDVSSDTRKRFEDFMNPKDGINFFGCGRALLLAIDDRGIIQKKIKEETGIGSVSDLLYIAVILVTVVAVVKAFFHILSIICFNMYLVRLILRASDTSGLHNSPVGKRRKTLWQLAADRKHFRTSAIYNFRN